MWSATRYLKFDTHEAAYSALVDAFGKSDDNLPILSSGTHAVDVVGVIYRPTGETKEVRTWSEYLKGEEKTTVEVMEAIEGYHVNIRVKGELPSVLEPYEIATPNAPKRVFADGSHK
jgi:hypothetical protein